MTTLRMRLASAFVLLLVAGPASAQQGPAPETPPPGGPAPNVPAPGAADTLTIPTERGDVVITPGSTTSTQVYVPPPGFPAPGVDLNPGLPSSSRPTNDTSRSQDGFDLNQRSQGASMVRGDANGQAILSAPRSMSVPAIHTVRPGDTLWDLCAQYFGNPYNWPRVWSYNPQVQNPHWIYPGDQLRMNITAGGPGAPVGVTTAGGPAFIGRPALVPRTTIFLYSQGLLADSKRDLWGEVVGAREDQMLLGQGNQVYLGLRVGVAPRIGETLTIFHRVAQPEKVEGARRPPGEIVVIKGTVRIDRWDPKTRIARGLITESVDAIERGSKVGAIKRRLDIVPPKPSRAMLSAYILGSIYPHEYLGQNQIVFLDRGSNDGLVPGNRLRIVRKGDAWRRSLKTAAASTIHERPLMDSPGQADTESVRLRGDDEHFPEEVVGEVRVLSTERYSSVALVTASNVEIATGDRAVATRGY